MSSKPIVVVDYGMGNLGSIFNMFKRIGVKANISADLEEISNAEKILLPGVGSFDRAMEKIASLGLKEVLDKKALVDKIPVLGICLGMQLLTKSSEEGKLPGLGWIPAKTIRFRFERGGLKVPHMGWNTVELANSSALTHDFADEPRFYFVHSYYVKVEDEKNSIMKTTYGLEFNSGIQNDNIYGAQFHPEKSHKFGMKLLQNFAAI